MNPFYITWTILFVTFYIGQSTSSKLAPNKDSVNGIRCDTYMQPHEINYVWAIHQFPQYEAFNNELLSPMLRAPSTDEYEWYVKMHPSCTFDGNETISLRVYLSKNSTVGNALAMVNVSIINDAKEVLFYNNFSSARAFPAGSTFQGWGWSDFRIKDDFFRNHLLQNDTLTLFIHITWLSKSSTNEVTQFNISSIDSAHETSLNKKRNFTQDSEWMLENPKFADVVFVTNGSSYPARKNILAASSPVFAAMFKRKDSKNGPLKKIRINVTPMNEKVLRAMLQYIHTGKCAELGDLTEKLLEAAIKYGLDGLQKICQQRLPKTWLTKEKNMI